MIPLLLSHAKYVGTVACLVLALALWHEHDTRIAHEAVLAAQLHTLTQRDAVLADSIKTVRATVRRDTIHAIATIRSYRTIRDTVREHLTDTVMVKAALSQADTAIHACQAVILSCGELNALKDKQLAVKDSTIAGLKYLSQHRKSNVAIPALAGLVAGILVHAVLTR